MCRCHLYAVKVGIIGTGMLGSAVGMRMIAKGAKLAVYNRTFSKTKKLSEAGATVVDSPADVVVGCDLVITCVTDAGALESVCFGPRGLGIAKKCPVICDMSTIRPEESREITKKLEACSVTMLGTPVMGGPDAAAAGELVMMVSGSETRVFEKVRLYTASFAPFAIMRMPTAEPNIPVPMIPTFTAYK